MLTVAAVQARSVALAGFGLDSLVEIAATTVVLWELSGTGEQRQRRALRLIAAAFIAPSIYIGVQSAVLISGYHPDHSPLGIAWTAITAAVMFGLAAGKIRVGRALGQYCAADRGAASPSSTVCWRPRCSSVSHSKPACMPGGLICWPGS